MVKMAMSNILISLDIKPDLVLFPSLGAFSAAVISSCSIKFRRCCIVISYKTSKMLEIFAKKDQC